MGLLAHAIKEQEGGHKVAVASDSEAVFQFFRNDDAVEFRPVHKGVVFVGDNLQGSLSTILVGSSTYDGTTIDRVDSSSDGVGLYWVGREYGDEVAVGVHSEGVVSIGRDLGAVFGPTFKGVTAIGDGAHCAGFTLFEGAATTNATSIGWAGRNADGVSRHGDEGEVGHEVAVGIHREGVACIIGNHSAVFGPNIKGVAAAGYGAYCAGFTLFEGASATDIATIGRVGRNADGKGLRDVSKVGDEGAVASHSEVVAGIGRNHGAVLGPVGEGVIGVGCSGDGARLSFCVGAAT